MTPEQEERIRVLMRLRRLYSLKNIAREFQCSVKTLYRVSTRQPKVTKNETPPSEAQSQ